MIGTGGKSLVMALGRLIAEPGDVALIDDPTDRQTRVMLDWLGVAGRNAEIDSGGLDVDRIGADVRMALLHPSAEGATGVVMSAGRRYSVMAWARKHSLPIIEDDFDSLVDSPPQYVRSLKTLDTDGLCIYVADLSRTLMPGVKISFAIVPPRIVEACRAFALLPVAPPSIGEQVALASLLQSEEFTRHMKHMRSVYKERLDALTFELQTQLGGAVISVARRAPLQAIVQLSDEFRDTEIADAAAKRRLDLTPLSTTCPGQNALIIGYGGMPPDSLPGAVRALAESFKATRPMSRVSAAST